MTDDAVPRTCSVSGKYDPNSYQPWLPLKYGFEDWINETLHSFPPVRWRSVTVGDQRSDQFAGQALVVANPDHGHAYALEKARSARQPAAG